MKNIVMLFLIVNIICFTACKKSVDKIDDSNVATSSQMQTSISSISSSSSQSTAISSSSTSSISNIPSVTSKSNTSISSSSSQTISSSATSNTSEQPVSSNNIVPFSAEHVKKLNVDVWPPVYEAYDLNDKKDIEKVVTYLNQLHPFDTDKNYKGYLGGGYSLTFTLNDGTVNTIWLIGNIFLKIGDKAQELPYEEASAFDKVSSKFVMNSYDKKGLNSTKGRVVSVKSEESGENISCVMKDASNKNYTVIMSVKPIIDTTGNGCLILNKGDLIDVRHKSVDKNINAEVIFILESAQ